MRHLKSGRKLKRNSSHRKALLNNLATSLFEHKKIVTTEAKAKELRAFAETLITKAKNALKNEKLGLLPEGHKVDIHNRRIVGRFITNKAVLQELFNTIAPMVEERPGGYTRIIKLGTRRGDGSPTAIIELVDWSAPQDGAVSTKSRRKGKAAQTATPTKKEKAAPKKETASTTPVVSEEFKETESTVSETLEATIESQDLAKEETQEKIIVETSATEVQEVSAETSQESETKTEPDSATSQDVAEVKNETDSKVNDNATDSTEEKEEDKS